MSRLHQSQDQVSKAGRRAGTLAFLSVFLLTQSACRISSNFHEVHEGNLYRSAQLHEREFEIAIKKLGIRTIINLRGAHPGEGWYDAETKVARKYGVTLIDIGMSAKRLPHPQHLASLLDAYRDAARPILIHCKAGADRTGEAAAIYAMEYMGKSRKEALAMLTPRYLHIEQFMPAKRYFIRELYQGLDWAYHSYDPCLPGVKYYDQDKYCTGGSESGDSEIPSSEVGSSSGGDT